MASTETINSTVAPRVVIHPLVLLSIQDHAARVARGTKKRVVGILLGQDLGQKGINVANSFAGQRSGLPLESDRRVDPFVLVPFEEDDKDARTWFLDHNYIEAMNDMFKKVNGTQRTD